MKYCAKNVVIELTSVIALVKKEARVNNTFFFLKSLNKSSKLV